MAIELTDIQAARKRIAPYIRRTPLLTARPVRNGLSGEWPLYLKLEQLQVSGSFKARGAVNKVLSLEGDVQGLVTASGGNHGIGVAYAGWLKQLPTTIFLPIGTPPEKAARITGWNARLVYHGEVWDEANAAAQAFAVENGLTYIHPFADPVVIAGQGTLGLEILEDAPELDTLLVAIGGGGLVAGVSLAVHALNPALKVIGIEPVGAPTLAESLRAGQVVELPSISTKVGTLAPRQSHALNFDIIAHHVSQIGLVSDEEMAQAQSWLWQELGLAAELSGVAALAALLTGRVRPQAGERVGVIICGSNTELQFA